MTLFNTLNHFYGQSEFHLQVFWLKRILFLFVQKHHIISGSEVSWQEQELMLRPERCFSELSHLNNEAQRCEGAKSVLWNCKGTRSRVRGFPEPRLCSVLLQGICCEPGAERLLHAAALEGRAKGERSSPLWGTHYLRIHLLEKVCPASQAVWATPNMPQPPACCLLGLGPSSAESRKEKFTIFDTCHAK